MRFRGRRFGRSIGVTIMLLLSAAWALAPRFVLACGGLDAMSCTADGAQYSFFEAIAKVLWQINRILLITAYQLTAIRAWVVDVAFASAYDQLITIISPAIIPVATLALTLAFVAIMAVPITGSASPFNIRQILIWTLFGPIVLTLMGPWLADVDNLRMNMGLQMYQVGSQANVSQLTLSGASEGDMDVPQRIYPHVACGVVLGRYTNDGSFDGYDDGSTITRIDEQVASFLSANGTDIHCPQQTATGPDADLPASYYDANGANYAVVGGISILTPEERAARIAAIQRGITRLFIGLLPATLAVVYFMIQLVLTLCLIALWVAFPLGMIFGMFRKDQSWLGGYFRNAALVLQASWTASFILGLITAALIAAANSGNAAVFAGSSIGSLFFSVYLLSQSVTTFRGALDTLGAVAGTLIGGTGGAVSAGVGAVRGLGSGLAGAATGGASLAAGGAAAAFTGATALARTGSGRYAAGAVIGRSKALSAVGEVAASAGLLSTEVADGMYAGSVTQRNLRQGVKTFDKDGRVYRDVANQRQAERGLAKDQPPPQASGASSYIGLAQPRSRAGEAVERRATKPGDVMARTWNATRQQVVAQNRGNAAPPSYAKQSRMSLSEAATRMRAGATVTTNRDGSFTTWNPKDGRQMRRGSTLQVGRTPTAGTASTGVAPTAQAQRLNQGYRPKDPNAPLPAAAAPARRSAGCTPAAGATATPRSAPVARPSTPAARPSAVPPMPRPRTRPALAAAPPAPRPLAAPAVPQSEAGPVFQTHKERMHVERAQRRQAREAALPAPAPAPARPASAPVGTTEPTRVPAAPAPAPRPRPAGRSTYTARRDPNATRLPRRVAPPPVVGQIPPPPPDDDALSFLDD